MNLFSSSKNKIQGESPRSPSPLARFARAVQTRKEHRKSIRLSSDSLLECSTSSDFTPNSSPGGSPDLRDQRDSYFGRSYSLPLFRSKTDLRYAHIFGKDFYTCNRYVLLVISFSSSLFVLRMPLL